MPGISGENRRLADQAEKIFYRVFAVFALQSRDRVMTLQPVLELTAERIGETCYTRFALSDLVVSGVLPSLRQPSLAQISPSPLQRALEFTGGSVLGLRMDQSTE